MNITENYPKYAISGRMELHACVLQDIGPLGPQPKKGQHWVDGKSLVRLEESTSCRGILVDFPLSFSQKKNLIIIHDKTESPSILQPRNFDPHSELLISPPFSGLMFYSKHSLLLNKRKAIILNIN